MVVIRCTRKLLHRLGRHPGSDASSTTTLGDSYATILFTKPQQVILLVNATTRLPVVIPAREVSTIPVRFTLGSVLPALIVHLIDKADATDRCSES